MALGFTRILDRKPLMQAVSKYDATLQFNTQKKNIVANKEADPWVYR